MKRLGQKSGSFLSRYQGARAGGKKEDLLRYWDSGTQEEPVSQEEFSQLEDEWLDYQHKQHEGRRDLRTDAYGDEIEWEEYKKRYPSVAESIGKPRPEYKGGPLELRRSDDNAFDSMVKAATKNEYKIGE